MTFAPNLQILANAGSGKTHTLVTRIIRLLMMGIPPRRIIALTFTRKAAGEFLSKLLQRLAVAASDEKEASDLSIATGLPGSCAAYRSLLRRVVDDLGKLQLTTLDSFFHRVVSAFPQELGLSGTPTLLDTHAQELAGRQSLRHALRKLSTDEKALLLQSLMERDEGSASSSVGGDLAKFREEMHQAFLENPSPEVWGNPKRIWGTQENLWKALSPADLVQCREVVELEIEQPDFPAKAKDSWRALSSMQRGSRSNSIAKQILDNLSLWKSGTASLLYYKKSYTITPEAQRAAAALAEHYLHECTEYRLREARAVHHLLTHYEREYAAEVRARGLLSFSDITTLLQPDAKTGEAPESMTRLQLDERLDALFDHWLLDEFQDTSRSQYRALENILDEVISEAARGGERSFFCVGDIKQAIYGWRKGDARLFDEIHTRYSQGSGGLLRDALSVSWRSAPEILKTLNAVFGNLPLTASSLPESVKDRWQAAWAEHHCAPRNAKLPGYFSWESCNDRDGIEEKIIGLLKEVQARLRQGMTVALLVRSGKEASEWLEVLRAAGIEALSESNPPVGRDNPLAAAIRSAFSLMVHPGDTFALHHLSMEPLRFIFFPSKEKEKRDEELSEFIRHASNLLAKRGFTAVTEWLLSLLAPLIADEFSKGRAAALHRAAIKADAAGLMNCDDFLEFLSEYEEPGRAAPQAVQVMTVHKAKGLEYDMVLLPLAEKQTTLDSLGRSALDLWHNPSGDPFLMQLPAEEIRDVPGNETLALAAENKRQEETFEELCVWYVAMSRAKQALYLFSAEPKKLEKNKCPNFPQLLAAGLENLEGFENHSSSESFCRSLGDKAWFEKFTPKPSEQIFEALPENIVLPPRTVALQKIRPSDADQESSMRSSLMGSNAFEERKSQAVTLGTEIHALLESIDWLDGSSWNPSGDSSEEVRDLMISCLQHRAMHALFEKPQGNFTLWREQRFDLLIHERWLSGCFDRVLIYRDTEGRPTHADLIDFKTDQGTREQLIASYRTQMESYRQALSHLTNLPQEKIRMILVQLRSSEPVVFVG